MICSPVFGGLLNSVFGWRSVAEICTLFPPRCCIEVYSTKGDFLVSSDSVNKYPYPHYHMVPRNIAQYRWERKYSCYWHQHDTMGLPHSDEGSRHRRRDRTSCLSNIERCKKGYQPGRATGLLPFHAYAYLPHLFPMKLVGLRYFLEKDVAIILFFNALNFNTFYAVVSVSPFCQLFHLTMSSIDNFSFDYIRRRLWSID